MAETPAIPVVREVFISVASVVRASERDIVASVVALESTLAAHYSDYEIILVDLGLPDEEVAALREALTSVPCVRVIRVSPRTAYDDAVFAAIDAAIGDYVCLIDLGIDPIDELTGIVGRSRAGVDVVQGISRVPLGGGALARAGRNLFYWYNRRFLTVDIPNRATYFTVLTRRAVNALTSSRRRQRYFRHLVRHIGLRTEPYEYTPRLAGARGRSLRTGAMSAVEMISSYSSHPLRMVAYLGFVASGLNLVYAIYVVIVRLVSHEVEEGWTSMSLVMSLMFFLVFVILAILSEYMGRVLEESRNEPTYFVLEEFESDALLALGERRNVRDE